MNLHDLCRAGSEEDIEAYLDQLAAVNPDDLSFVLELKNDLRYSPLHVAIFARNIHAARVLVAKGADVDNKCHGTPPLHLCVATAVQPNGSEFAWEALELLLDANANVAAKDDHGFSAIHLAAEYGLHLFVDKLVKHSEDALDFVNGAPKLTGVTALHRAAAADAGLAIRTLLEHGARQGCKTSDLGMTPLHVAGLMGSAAAWAQLLSGCDASSRAELLAAKDALGRTPVELARRSGWEPDGADSTVLRSAFSLGATDVTLIQTNPICSQHHTCPPSQVGTPNAPPENTKRLHVLVHEEHGVLCASDLSSRLLWQRSGQPAALADVLRVHEWSYVRRLQEQCANIASRDPEDEELAYAHLDGDTAVCSETYNAALAAAGAVCQAVDAVNEAATASACRRARNAFCPVRPPGHHAGPKGLVKGQEPGAPDSHGFCILNNVSIGAAYAMNRYRETVKRVAIVDFDVHHGNGTEETVRWLRPSVETTAIHGSGGEVMGLMQSLAYKPWHSERDSANVMFVSVHGYGPRERGLEHMLPMAAFYPGTGRTVIPKLIPLPTQTETDTAGTAAVDPALTIGGSGDRGYQLDTAHAVAGGNVESDNDSSEGDGSGSGPEQGDEDGMDCSEDDSQSEDSLSLPVPTQTNAPLSADAVHRAVLQNKRIFSSFACATGTAALATEPAAFPQALPPLILDIGVALPSAGADGAEGRGKVLDELHYRIQWRRYFREQIFPRLVEFRPDMLFISAGFDAHKKDGINSGYIALQEEDFEWVTEKLVQLANTFCDGRVVSVLEGGYQLGGEFFSAFAQSAKAHVRALSNGTRSRAQFSLSETQGETALELQHLAVLEELRRAQLLRKEQAREQAYLARLKEREEQEERARQQAAQEADGAPQCPEVGADLAPASAAATDEDGGTGRKRRRQPVDYAALDLALRSEGANQPQPQ